jgi:hypothetical protein
MLKKSTSGVLASLRGSTYRSVRLASSLAAVLLDSLFEHPEVFPQPAKRRSEESRTGREVLLQDAQVLDGTLALVGVSL